MWETLAAIDLPDWFIAPTNMVIWGMVDDWVSNLNVGFMVYIYRYTYIYNCFNYILSVCDFGEFGDG